MELGPLVVPGAGNMGSLYVGGIHQRYLTSTASRADKALLTDKHQSSMTLYILQPLFSYKGINIEQKPLIHLSMILLYSISKVRVENECIG